MKKGAPKGPSRSNGTPLVGSDGASLEYEWESNTLYLTDDNSSDSV